MNVKILVCCHKLDIWASDSPYVPIHVGKELHPELDLKIQEDNAGDSISTVSYTHLTLPTRIYPCRSRWSPYH